MFELDNKNLEVFLAVTEWLEKPLSYLVAVFPIAYNHVRNYQDMSGINTVYQRHIGCNTVPI